MAPNRADRPQQHAEPEAAPENPADCPFCEGAEHETPGEVLAVRNDDSPRDAPGWQVRVVPNKYPALIDAPQGSTGGLHEVIIESPRHETRMSRLPVPQWMAVLAVYRQRLAAVRQAGRYPYAQIFKNAGLAAGATLEHVHSQLLALPVVPPQVQRELDAAQAHWASSGRCIYCELIERELVAGERVIQATNDWIALAPYASRVPYESWILPRWHGADFDLLADRELPALAATLRDVTTLLERSLRPPAYNWLIHTSPFDTSASDHYHWHIEILPRVTHLAGFEWASGCYLNVVTPEQAAATLRAAAE